MQFNEYHAYELNSVVPRMVKIKWSFGLSKCDRIKMYFCILHVSIEKFWNFLHFALTSMQIWKQALHKFTATVITSMLVVIVVTVWGKLLLFLDFDMLYLMSKMLFDKLQFLYSSVFK